MKWAAPKLPANGLKWVWLLAVVLNAGTLFAFGQSDGDVSLKGAIDIHAYQSPDSVARVMDADDLARYAKEKGMRGLVMKNHYEDTAAIVFMIRKEVPGIELYGGITQDLANGGINLEAVKHMVAMKGGYGRVVTMPTFDSEADVKFAGKSGPSVPVSKDGELLPAVKELVAWVAQHPDLVLETGHISPEESLLLVHEAHERGVKHIVVNQVTFPSIKMTIPQMQEAANQGAYIEFTYIQNKLDDTVKAIQAVGAKSCILATDSGGVSRPPAPQRPPGPDLFLEFMQAVHQRGISTTDIDLMVKSNPALALGLAP
jgi:hypothetical protein